MKFILHGANKHSIEIELLERPHCRQVCPVMAFFCYGLRRWYTFAWTKSLTRHTSQSLSIHSFSSLANVLASTFSVVQIVKRCLHISENKTPLEPGLILGYSQPSKLQYNYYIGVIAVLQIGNSDGDYNNDIIDQNLRST